MYVCICTGLTDGRLQRLLEEGRSLGEVQQETGAGTHCGKCIHEMRRIEEMCRAEERQPAFQTG
jgi:bacterioferritin-associated ferredoxin